MTEGDDQPIIELPKLPPKQQLRPRLKVAITCMVTEGLTMTDSARRAGMSLHGLQIALRKPHVRSYVTDVRRAWHDNRTSLAWLNMARLADGATSEDVQFKANKTFLEAAGELGAGRDDGAALAKTLVQIIVNQAQQPDQLRGGQLSGVIEVQSQRAIAHDPSNSRPVGRGEIRGDDDDEG